MPRIVKGTTDVTRHAFVVDDSDGSPETSATITNFNLQYTRFGEAPSTKVDVTALAATNSDHSDNKMKEVDATDSKGLYRVDWPDAAFAIGAAGVVLTTTSSDAFQPCHETIELVDELVFAPGAALSTPPKASTAGFTITSGENEANTEDSTFALDGTTHDLEAVLDSTQKIECYYEFTVGGDGIATGVKWHGRLDRGGGVGKHIDVFAYDWDNTQFDQIGQIDSSGALEDHEFTVFKSHTGTGTDLGKVRIRFKTGGVAFTATTKLITDQILVEYTIVRQSVGYEGGQIWIDTGASNTNTESFVDGTADNPVSTLAAAITISGNTNLTDFHMLNGSSITLVATSSKHSYFGDNWTLALGGVTMVGIHVQGATVSGAMAGTGANQSFDNCQLGAMSIIKDTHMENCRITGTQTLIEAGAVYYNNCHSGASGGTPPTLDFGGALASSDVHFHNYSGGLNIENMGDVVTDTLHFDGIGHLIEGTCTAGAVTIQGIVSLSGITNLTITEVARVAPDQIADFSGRVFNGTSTASSTTTKIFVQSTDTPTTAADDDFNDTLLVAYDTGTRGTARMNIRAVDDYDDSDPSFTVSPALAFTPGSGDIIEVWRADTGALSLLSTIASGFGSASPDRLIDHLRSIMSKGAVTPATLGTYDPAADSLEFASERRNLMEGAGFSTATDSLEAIRDAIDVLVAPAVVSASSLSGSGFLSDVVSLVRKATDEPNNSPKYTDGDIVELIQAGMDAVITDIQAQTDHPLVVRYNITLVSGTQFYVLPPSVATLIRVAKINTSSGIPEYESWPGSYMNPAGHGWKIEGNVIRFLRDWQSTDTLELMYHPNAEPLMHKATATSATSTGLVFPASVTDGTLGTRPNEYVGMLARLITNDSGLQEERLITAYDVATRAATIAHAWDTTPSGTIVYEVVPIFSRLIKHVIALRTAIDLLSQEGNSQRMATLNQNYQIKLSAMRRALASMEGRFPHHFDGDTWDNTSRGGTGFGV